MDALKSETRNEFKRMTAHQAERELNHLEAVLKSSTCTFAMTAVRGLDLEYWTSRVGVIDSQYDLMAAQKRRVASLTRLLETFTPTGDDAPVKGRQLCE
jgi:hypothetical protein